VRGEDYRAQLVVGSSVGAHCSLSSSVVERSIA
jgi:hypothetical protein